MRCLPLQIVLALLLPPNSLVMWPFQGDEYFLEYPFKSIGPELKSNGKKKKNILFSMASRIQTLLIIYDTWSLQLLPFCNQSL